MHPRPCPAEAQYRLKFEPPAVGKEWRSARVIQNVISAIESHSQNGDWASYAIPGERQEKIVLTEAEGLERMHLDDGAVFHIARAVHESLRGGGPIVVLTPFGRI